MVVWNEAYNDLRARRNLEASNKNVSCERRWGRYRADNHVHFPRIMR